MQNNKDLTRQLMEEKKQPETENKHKNKNSEDFRNKHQTRLPAAFSLNWCVFGFWICQLVYYKSSANTRKETNIDECADRSTVAC